MRLLLLLVGAGGFVATGWICWRATAETREWREFLALGTKPRRNQVEWDRFVYLGRRHFPDEAGSWHPQVAILDVPGEDRRVLVVFAFRDKGGREARLHVLEEDGRQLSSCEVPVGPCGTECRPAPERGPRAFDVLALSPGAPRASRYRLVDDRPVLVSPADKE